jgi:F-type H+-transporting ATPase subunit gamma
MAKARDIKRRILSLQKTRQITKTMELVATSRMKKTQQRVLAARPYAERLRSILSAIDVEPYAAEFPLLARREKVRRVAILLVTSNRGLCGAFNANVIRLGRRTIRDLQADGVETELHVIGKKGTNALRYRGQAIASSRIDIGDRPAFDHAREIARVFMEKFLRGEIDELRVVSASFRSLSSQPPVAETVLPLKRAAEGVEPAAEFLLEPSPRDVLGELLPRIAEHRVFLALLENAAGEQAARRVAMKNATDNAEELIRILTRSYNRARQGQITQELAEIVGGAEALV